MATRTRAKQSAYPVVLTFQTTLTQEARLQHARATRAVNMSQFIRDAVNRALDELEGKTEPAHARRIAMPPLAAADRSR